MDIPTAVQLQQPARYGDITAELGPGGLGGQDAPFKCANCPASALYISQDERTLLCQEVGWAGQADHSAALLSAGRGQQKAPGLENVLSDVDQEVNVTGNCLKTVSPHVQDAEQANQTACLNSEHQVCDGHPGARGICVSSALLVHARLSGMRARRATLYDGRQATSTKANIVAGAPGGFKASSLKVDSYTCLCCQTITCCI